MPEQQQPARGEHIPDWATRLTRELNELETTVAALKSSVSRVEQNVSNVNICDLKDNVERLCILIEGDPRLGVAGLRSQMADVAKLTKAMDDERQRLKWILIGVGLTGVTNAGALISVLIKVLGGGG